MALLADDIYALQDLAGWVRRHGIYQVRSALKHCLKEAAKAPDNVALAESMEHALVVDADEAAGDDNTGEVTPDGGEQQPLMPEPESTSVTTEPSAPEPPAAEVAEVAEVPPAPAATSKSKAKRATYPKGHAKAGEFIPDDPSTPENEAFIQE